MPGHPPNRPRPCAHGRHRDPESLQARNPPDRSDTTRSGQHQVRQRPSLERQRRVVAPAPSRRQATGLRSLPLRPETKSPHQGRRHSLHGPAHRVGRVGPAPRFARGVRPGYEQHQGQEPSDSGRLRQGSACPQAAHQGRRNCRSLEAGRSVRPLSGDDQRPLCPDPERRFRLRSQGGLAPGSARKEHDRLLLLVCSPARGPGGAEAAAGGGHGGQRRRCRRRLPARQQDFRLGAHHRRQLLLAAAQPGGLLRPSP